MKTLMMQQGSEEWFEARKGVPSASNFKRILTAKTMRLSAQSHDYVCELIGEVMSLIPPEGVENFTNRAVRWGAECEAEARRWYSMDTNLEVQQVGFVIHDSGHYGCSPDGLVGPILKDGQIVGCEGGIELKCPQAATQAGYVLGDPEVPAEYLAQVHGALIVTGAKWWDWLAYSPGLPAVRVRVEPNEYTAKLAEALEEFWEKYQAALAKIRSMS